MDDVISENSSPGRTIRLILQQVIFPYRIILRGWYNGRANITHLVFDSCYFRRIERKAFKMDVFIPLSSLRLDNLDSIDCDKDMLSGLPTLGGIYIQNTTFQRLEQPFLLPVRSFFSEFVYTDSNLINLDDLFGTFRLFRLKSVQFFNVKSLTTLASSNFTGLSAIQKLEIRMCGVKVITEDAFEYILETLMSLNLGNNKIKTLHAMTFNALIQRNMVMRTLSMLQFRGNAMICDCNLFEANNMLLLGFHERNIHYYTLHTACLDQFDPDTELKLPKKLECNNLRAIHGKKICLKLEHIHFLLHPIFRLKMDQNYENVQVISSNERQFRLWIQANGNSMAIDDKRLKCPKMHWVLSSVVCKLYADDVITKIPIHQFMHNSDVTMICLNYLLHRGEMRFWPLNCISTVRKTGTVHLSVLMEIWTINCYIIVVCIIVGLVTGTLIILIYKIYSLWIKDNMVARKR